MWRTSHLPRAHNNINTKPQRKQNIIHALAHADSNGDATEQTIPPSYGGFHASLNRKQGKSKTYYIHMSYNQPPNKSVVMMSWKSCLSS